MNRYGRTVTPPSRRCNEEFPYLRSPRKRSSIRRLRLEGFPVPIASKRGIAFRSSASHWGVKPDILVTAKGITSACVPLGLCATTGKKESPPSGASRSGKSPKKSCSARFLRQVDEDKALPYADMNRYQAILGTVKVANAGKLRHALERTIQAIGPAVIRTP